MGQTLFFTYTISEAKDYSAQKWRLIEYDILKNTHRVLHDGSHGTRAPCVQRDLAGNIYLLHPDTLKGRIHFYRFERASEYRLVKEAAYYLVPGPGYKFSCGVDQTRDTLLFIGNSGRLVIFDRQGAVLSDQAVVEKTGSISLQYPHIAVTPTGRIYLAWTASDDEHRWWYTFIGYIYSNQAGVWNVNKQTIARVPVRSDDPSSVLGVAKQQRGHPPLNRFLASMLPVNNRVHFAFSQLNSTNDYKIVFTHPSSNTQQHAMYVPDFPAPLITEAPISDGNIIANGIDGALSTDPAGALYYVTSTEGKYLNLFASYDQGKTWHALKKVAVPVNRYPYAIGSTRQTDYNGRLFGTFPRVGFQTT